MPWMPSEKSGFLLGVGDAAAHVASRIADRADRSSYLHADANQAARATPLANPANVPG
jgi:hypothetical protein